MNRPRSRAPKSAPVSMESTDSNTLPSAVVAATHVAHDVQEHDVSSPDAVHVGVEVNGMPPQMPAQWQYQMISKPFASTM